MFYKGENLPTEIQPAASECKKSTGSQHSGRMRIVAFPVIGALTLAALPHGVECVGDSNWASRVCPPEAPVRHEVHIEMSAGSTSVTTSHILTFTFMPDATPAADPSAAQFSNSGIG